MNWESLIPFAIGALLQGAVTWGVVKVTLRHHAKGIEEAKGTARRAHERIDGVWEHLAVARRG